ncbi:hypothetical protein HK099_005554 [Clydaea vesicula]|uniref:Uncharacterized protein n=1 Tax=Clydaea vesicula TaxID=447962 RepID=A0AAD5U1F9_9FUNG|nr:hypothetical protein HK099_005554 [Clydaea vesicula]
MGHQGIPIYFSNSCNLTLTKIPKDLELKIINVIPIIDFSKNSLSSCSTSDKFLNLKNFNLINLNLNIDFLIAFTSDNTDLNLTDLIAANDQTFTLVGLTSEFVYQLNKFTASQQPNITLVSFSDTSTLIDEKNIVNNNTASSSNVTSNEGTVSGAIIVSLGIVAVVFIFAIVYYQCYLNVKRRSQSSNGAKKNLNLKTQEEGSLGWLPEPELQHERKHLSQDFQGVEFQLQQQLMKLNKQQVNGKKKYKKKNSIKEKNQINSINRLNFNMSNISTSNSIVLEGDNSTQFSRMNSVMINMPPSASNLQRSSTIKSIFKDRQQLQAQYFVENQKKVYKAPDSLLVSNAIDAVQNHTVDYNNNISTEVDDDYEENAESDFTLKDDVWIPREEKSFSLTQNFENSNVDGGRQLQLNIPLKGSSTEENQINFNIKTKTQSMARESNMSQNGPRFSTINSARVW